MCIRISLFIAVALLLASCKTPPPTVQEQTLLDQMIQQEYAVLDQISEEFEKACVPYLDGASDEEVMQLMQKHNYGDFIGSIREIGKKTRVFENRDKKIQIHLARQFSTGHCSVIGESSVKGNQKFSSLINSAVKKRAKSHARNAANAFGKQGGHKVRHDGGKYLVGIFLLQNWEFIYQTKPPALSVQNHSKYAPHE